MFLSNLLLFVLISPNNAMHYQCDNTVCLTTYSDKYVYNVDEEIYLQVVLNRGVPKLFCDHFSITKANEPFDPNARYYGHNLRMFMWTGEGIQLKPSSWSSGYGGECRLEDYKANDFFDLIKGRYWLNSQNQLSRPGMYIVQFVYFVGKNDLKEQIAESANTNTIKKDISLYWTGEIVSNPIAITVREK